MEYKAYVYLKPEANLIINKMPIWFRELDFDGDTNEGHLILQSQDEYDEIWGSNAKLDISWEKKERTSLFYAKEVQKSIDTYNAIGLVVTKKENDWLLSHEFSRWFGQRTKMLRKRFYKEKSIHAVFYCDKTERMINLHCAVIEKYYENYKPYIIAAFNSVVCHPI